MRQRTLLSLYQEAKALVPTGVGGPWPQGRLGHIPGTPGRPWQAGAAPAPPPTPALGTCHTAASGLEVREPGCWA